MKFSDPKEKVPTDDSSDPALLQNKCRKFNPFYKNNADNKRAVLYLKLLSSGCPKSLALRFSSKNICRVDSTKKTDGPTDFRILKVKDNKHYTHKARINRKAFIIIFEGMAFQSS